MADGLTSSAIGSGSGGAAISLNGPVALDGLRPGSMREGRRVSTACLSTAEVGLGDRLTTAIKVV